MSDIGTTKRSSISPTRRLRIFEAHRGICHLCSRKIIAGEAWDVSHDRPLALGGADDEANMLPAHRACHRAYTAAEDAPRIAKAKRQKIKALGIKSPSRFQRPPGLKFDWRAGRYVKDDAR